MNRRTFLKNAGTLAAAATPLLRAMSPVSAARPLRVAHITDTHVTDNANCHAGLERMLAGLAALDPAPDFVLHTGDVIFDAWSQTDPEKTDMQWKVWRAAAAKLPAPLRACIGNHDYWAGEKRERGRFRHELRAMEELQLEHPWYAFEQGGWRFLVLESTKPLLIDGKSSYAARISPEQLEWFAGEVARTPATQPLAVCSHIPILSAAVHDWGQFREKVPDFPTEGRNSSAWMSIGVLMHSDSWELQKVLRRHGGVTLCLSGHLHLQDHVVYDGVNYLGNGAVSADWWKNPTFHQTGAGFAVLDLHPDGRWERTYHSCAWA